VFALHAVARDSIGGAPPPLLSGPSCRSATRGGLVLSNSAKKIAVWLSVTVLGRCGNNVGSAPSGL
jgi:hypothetical protein